MKVIVAIDDDRGMLFNHRRQSQDEELRKKVVEICKTSTLWMNAYSQRQFGDTLENVRVSETFLSDAGQNDYCFIEDQEMVLYADKIDEMIIFHWNRRYPSDLKLDYLPENNNMHCITTEEFKGKSHDKITMEVWGKDGI